MPCLRQPAKSAPCPFSASASAAPAVLPASSRFLSQDVLFLHPQQTRRHGTNPGEAPGEIRRRHPPDDHFVSSLGVCRGPIFVAPSPGRSPPLLSLAYPTDFWKRPSTVYTSLVVLDLEGLNSKSCAPGSGWPASTSSLPYIVLSCQRQQGASSHKPDHSCSISICAIIIDSTDEGSATLWNFPSLPIESS